jgi:DNA processing protein
VEGELTAGGEERAIIRLWGLPGVGARTVERLRDQFGSVAAAVEAGPEAIRPLLPSAARRFADKISTANAYVDLVLRSAEVSGSRILFAGSAEWPRQFAGIPDSPPILFVRGNLPPQAPRVAVVGSRSTDDYGRHAASLLGRELAGSGVSVVSGGAVGVDSAAHAAALEVGQTTVVLGCGADVVYPRLNRKLFDRILDQGGALVSSFPPQTPPCEQNFPVRNRVIAALCDAVVVARAGTDSGAQMTARAAHRMGRSVFGVCGRIGESQSKGVTRLILEGVARPIDGSADVLASLGKSPLVSSPAVAAAASSSPSASSPIPAAYVRVMEAMNQGPLPFDDIAAASGFAPGALASALTELEMLGLCQARIGGLYAVTPGVVFAPAGQAV